MSPSRLYPSGFRLLRRSRRFSSMSTSTLSMSSGSCWVSSRNFRNRGRNAVTRFFHFTFLSNLMCPLRARMVSLRRDTLYLTVFRRGTVRTSSASALSRPSPWRARADRPDYRGQRFGGRCRDPGGPEVLRVRWRPWDLRDHVRRFDGGGGASHPPAGARRGPRQRRSHERAPRRRLLRRPTNASTSRASVREEPPRRRLHARRIDGGVPGPWTTPPRGRRIGPPEGRHRVPGVVPSRSWRRNHQFPRGPGLTKPTSRRRPFVPARILSTRERPPTNFK